MLEENQQTMTPGQELLHVNVAAARSTAEATLRVDSKGRGGRGGRERGDSD